MLLEQAINLITGNTPVLGCQTVQLKDCFGRVCSENNRARLAVPSYDQSTRDGYAICGSGRSVGESERCYLIKGEIQAGLCHHLKIGPNEAYRIMTGGLIPEGTDRIVTQEDCRITDSEVSVAAHQLAIPHRFIRACGCEHQAQETIAETGTRLNESHLALLAATGNGSVEVYKRPKVAFFCSGSELVMADKQLRSGQKISSNHYLLDCLIKQVGGSAEGYGVVADDRQEISLLLQKIIATDADIIISTGGVGPGKYDLFNELLPEEGAEILYRSLLVRPGRSTLFGIIGNKLYFGLPGPPPAVNILFQELICPALKKMQGIKAYHNQRVSAYLGHKISLKSADVLCFKDACYRLERGRIIVRYPEKYQTPNCSIMMVPGTTSYNRDDMVTISLSEPI